MDRTLYYFINYGFYVVVSYKKSQHLKYCIKVDDVDFNVELLNISEIENFHLEPICEPKEYPEKTKIYPSITEAIDLINKFKNKS